MMMMIHFYSSSDFFANYFYSVLTDLITEANATKSAIEEATASIENVTEASIQHQHAAAQQQRSALQQTNNFESNLFGFDSAPAPAPMPAPGSMMGAPPPAAQDGGLPAPDSFGGQSYDSGLPPQTEVPLANSSDAASMMNQPASSPQGGTGGFPDIVPSASTDSGFYSNDAESVASGHSGHNPFGDEQSAWTSGSGLPEPTGGASVDMPSPSTGPPAAANQLPPQQKYQQPPPPADMGQYHQQQYQYPPPADYGMPQPYHQMPPQGHPQAMPTPQTQQSYMPHQTPVATPQYGLARPSVDHHRKESVGGFGGDWVMGGTAPPVGAGGGVYDAAATATAHAEAHRSSTPENAEGMAKLEELRKKYKAAQEIASDAAATHIKLVQEADELRGDADKAEANARSLRTAADEKKKGRFGSNNKKKSLNVS